MFLLLTAGILSVALFALAKLAKAFGIQIKGKALALAGVFALAIALVLPLIAPFLTEDYYLKLGALTVAAALLVTGYNAYLWKKDPHAADEEAEEEEGAEGETLADRTRAAIGPARFKWEKPLGEPDVSPEASAPAIATEPATSEPWAFTIAPQPVFEPPTPWELTIAPQPHVSQPPSQRGGEPEGWGVSLAKPSEEHAASSAGATENTTPEPWTFTIAPQPHVSQPPSQRGGGPEGWGVSLAKPSEEPAVPPAGATEDTTPEPWELTIPAPAPDPMEDIRKEIALLQTLDDFLDYADAAQKQGDLTRATTAYANAVDRFVDDPYILYLYMDLGNLLKQQARYADCTNVYHAALSIPQLAENPAIAREFENGIRYLGVVQAVLKRHHAEATPFGDIPDAIRAEIEAADQALAEKQASKGA